MLPRDDLGADHRRTHREAGRPARVGGTCHVCGTEDGDRDQVEASHSVVSAQPQGRITPIAGSETKQFAPVLASGLAATGQEVIVVMIVSEYEPGLAYWLASVRPHMHQGRQASGCTSTPRH